MDSYKVEQLEKMLKHETSKEEEHYGAHLNEKSFRISITCSSASSSRNRALTTWRTSQAFPVS